MVKLRTATNFQRLTRPRRRAKLNCDSPQVGNWIEFTWQGEPMSGQIWCFTRNARVFWLACEDGWFYQVKVLYTTAGEPDVWTATRRRRA